MKTIIAILAFSLSMIQFAQAQNSNFVTKHMKAYMDDDDFTSINMSLSGSLAKDILNDLEIDGIDKKMNKWIKNLKQFHVLITEKNTKKHYENVLAIIKKEAYKPLMSIKSDGEGVRVVAKETKKGIEEVLLVVGGEDDFVVVSFSGNKG